AQMARAAAGRGPAQAARRAGILARLSVQGSGGEGRSVSRVSQRPHPRAAYLGSAGSSAAGAGAGPGPSAVPGAGSAPSCARLLGTDPIGDATLDLVADSPEYVESLIVVPGGL